MGGLRCAKEIIDNRNGLVRVLDCMATSIILAGTTGGSGIEPAYEDVEAFAKASEALAKVASGIEAKVRGG